MNKPLHVTMSVSVLLCTGVAAAFAQGLPAGTMPPVYVSSWSAQQTRTTAMNAPAVNNSQSGVEQAKMNGMAKQAGDTSPATRQGG